MAPLQPAAAPRPKRARRVPAKRTVLDSNPNPQSSPPDPNIHSKPTRQSPILVPDSPPPPSSSPSPLERVPKSINPSPAITTGIMERESVGTGSGGNGGLQDVQSLDCSNGSVDCLILEEGEKKGKKRRKVVKVVKRIVRVVKVKKKREGLNEGLVACSNQQIAKREISDGDATGIVDGCDGRNENVNVMEGVCEEMTERCAGGSVEEGDSNKSVVPMEVLNLVSGPVGVDGLTIEVDCEGAKECLGSDNLVAAVKDEECVMDGENEGSKECSGTKILVEGKRNDSFEGGGECSASKSLAKTETNEDIMLVEAGKVVSDCIEVGNLEIEEIYGEPKESCAGEPLLEHKKYNDVAEEVNVELDGDADGKCRVDGVEGTGGDKERGKGPLENKMVLSGELEALERRWKRRTQVFVGGLSVAAKEEDVRKVFEEVGEVVEVKVATNSKTGKSKGFAFVRYACAADAKNALERLRKVEICGKQCTTAFVDGNDTIFLGNIDKKWKDEDVIRLLRGIGIEKIDKVTVMVDPNNVEHNRGFAFLELETNKDAQIAFKKLQVQGQFGKLKNIKVAWAEPLSEPNEEELLKVKSVYAEYLPSTWDADKVRNYFKIFGEIESVVLARNLHSSRRKDFAFINFKSREDALACIKSFNDGLLCNEESKENVKVSLAKPLPKVGKPHKVVPKSTNVEISKQNMKAVQCNVKPTEPRINWTSPSYINNGRPVTTSSPSTSELEQRLAERALLKQTQARLESGLMGLDHSCSLSGKKRLFSSLGDGTYYSDHGEYSRLSMERSFAVGNPSHARVHLGVGISSLPHHLQHDVTSLASHSRQDVTSLPSHPRQDVTSLPSHPRQDVTSLSSHPRQDLTSLPYHRRQDVTSLSPHLRQDLTSLSHHQRETLTSFPHHQREALTSLPHHQREALTSLPHHQREDIISLPHYQRRDLIGLTSLPHHQREDAISLPHHQREDVISLPHHQRRDLVDMASLPHHQREDVISLPHHQRRDLTSISHHQWQDMTSLSQRRGVASLSQRRDITSLPQTRDITSLPRHQWQDMTSLPQRRDVTSLPQRRDVTSLPQRRDVTSLPHHQRQGADYSSGYRYTAYENGFQIDEAPHHRSDHLPYRCQRRRAEIRQHCYRNYKMDSSGCTARRQNQLAGELDEKFAPATFQIVQFV